MKHRDYPRIRLAGGEFIVANAQFQRDMPRYVTLPLSGVRPVVSRHDYVVTTVTLELRPLYEPDVETLVKAIQEGGLIDEISGAGSLARLRWET